MPSHSKTKIINRIIDANINRAKEGLRVCEEITRFILNSFKLTAEFKKVRHRLDSITGQLTKRIDLIQQRNTSGDVGRSIYINELQRKNFQDIFFANIQRVKESIRVLEEFAKLINKNCAVKFKKIRYGIYGIEKRAAKRISALSNH